MPAKPEIESQSEAEAFAESVAELVSLSLGAAEVVIAFAALWLIKGLESGRLARERADELFTALDARLTNMDGGTRLSDEAQELIFEAGHFHHYGEDYGPDPTHLRAAAFTILRRSERP
jgi:hypothetical protein